MAIPYNVWAVYQTVGTTHIIKAVFNKLDETLADITALQAATAGYDGVVEITSAQLTASSLRTPNDLLGWEHYDDAGVAKVRATITETNTYKVAQRRPILMKNLREQIEQVKWGLGWQFDSARSDRTANWMRKMTAGIAVDSVISDDTNYQYLFDETHLDATKWLVMHDTDTWPTVLAQSNRNLYRTNPADWSAVQLEGVTLPSGWHAKNLLEELVV